MVGKVTRKGGTSFIAGGKKESSDDLFILLFLSTLFPGRTWQRDGE